MKRIIINTTDTLSAILVGARWEAVTKLLPGSNTVIITDSNIHKIYGSRFPEFPVIKVKPGEQSKQMIVAERIAGELLKKGIDRTGFILAIGGGVVCDLAGFVASIYLRGIRCGYISTSLLSQVDASTGGKTGVNLGQVKNVIGTFRQPEFVICDTTMLRTLSEVEYLSGMAELIKTGLIGDRSIIDILHKEFPSVIRRDRKLMTDLVFRAVKVKASVVAKDEKESGLRRILNFGHTFGHAFELSSNMRHGFAVAAGMELAAGYSNAAGILSAKDFQKVKDILELFKLRNRSFISVEETRKLLRYDKKKSGDKINFVLLKGIGKPVTEMVPIEAILDFYREYIKNRQ